VNIKIATNVPIIELGFLGLNGIHVNIEIIRK